MIFSAIVFFDTNNGYICTNLIFFMHFRSKTHYAKFHAIRVFRDILLHYKKRPNLGRNNKKMRSTISNKNIHVVYWSRDLFFFYQRQAFKWLEIWSVSLDQVLVNRNKIFEVKNCSENIYFYIFKIFNEFLYFPYICHILPRKKKYKTQKRLFLQFKNKPLTVYLVR